MKYLLVPVLLAVMLFYLADQYFTHGAYFSAFRDWLQNLF